MLHTIIWFECIYTFSFLPSWLLVHVLLTNAMIDPSLLNKKSFKLVAQYSLPSLQIVTKVLLYKAYLSLPLILQLD